MVSTWQVAGCRWEREEPIWKFAEVMWQVAGCMWQQAGGRWQDWQVAFVSRWQVEVARKIFDRWQLVVGAGYRWQVSVGRLLVAGTLWPPHVYI